MGVLGVRIAIVKLWSVSGVGLTKLPDQENFVGYRLCILDALLSMKLDAADLRYISSEEFRVLTAVGIIYSQIPPRTLTI